MDLIGQVAQNWWHIPILMGMLVVYGFLLNLVLFKPVTRVLHAREKAVKEAGGISAHSKDELNRKFAEYERVVLEARRKASQVKEAAREEAYAYRTKLLDEVRAEVATEVKAQRTTLENERISAQADLKARTQEIAAAMASKILGREVTA